jgi:hypothetical protein
MAATLISFRQRILLSLCIVLATALNWLPQLDARAQDYLSDTIESNAVVFGVVRTLNGVISLVQSTEVGIGVAGVGIGEILDPINDLIERFSGLLLVTLTALGIQQVLLLFTVSLTLKIFFSGFALVTLIMLWQSSRYLSLVLRLALCFFIGRFLLSLEVGFVWLFDWLYFDATGQEALSVLDATAKVIDRLKETLTKIDLSDLIFGKVDTTISNEDVSARLSTSVVTLIVGMLFKSLLIPLGTLWAGFHASRALLKGSHRD